MKKILLIIVILITISSCERLYYVEVIIQNDSEHFIKIDAFFKGEAKESFSVQAGERHVIPQYFHPEDNSIIIFEESYIDSVTIKFNSERIIIQSCEEIYLDYCDIERNILLFDVYYEYEELGRKELQYTYYITEEDYNRALPIN